MRTLPRPYVILPKVQRASPRQVRSRSQASTPYAALTLEQPEKESTVYTRLEFFLDLLLHTVCHPYWILDHGSWQYYHASHRKQAGKGTGYFRPAVSGYDPPRLATAPSGRRSRTISYSIPIALCTRAVQWRCSGDDPLVARDKEVLSHLVTLPPLMSA